MSLIGLMCKRGDTFSLQVLIGRGLFLLILVNLSSSSCYLCFISSFKIIGAYGSEVTPVPIPNTEVKLIRVDDTWLVTARETKSVPTLLRTAFAVLYYCVNKPPAKLTRPCLLDRERVNLAGGFYLHFRLLYRY